MPRKTTDPALVKLLDREQRTLAEFERWYTRTRRAANRMDKAKRALARLAKRIRDHQAAPTT